MNIYNIKTKRIIDLNESLNTSNSSTTDSQFVQIYSTFWFIGLEIRQNTETAVDLDLTEPIQDFTDRGKY